MARITQDEAGNQWLHGPDGSMQPYYGEASIAAQAGRTMASIGSGIKQAYGYITENQALIDAAQAESAERNRIFGGTDEADPFNRVVGGALPGLATAPIAAAGLLPGLAVSAGVGALESALDIDQGGTAAQRGVAGGIGGVLGETGGRIAGRVLMGAEGLSQALAGRRLRGNEAAEAFEEVGGQTLAYQRMNDGMAQSFAERFSQGAQVGMFPSQRQKAVRRTNDELYKDTVARAVGLEPAGFDDLGEDFMDAAFTRLSDGFQEVSERAGSTAPMELNPLTAETLGNSPQIKELIKLGDFKGLDVNQLSGADWHVARQALAEDAANAFQNGRGRVGEKYLSMIDEIDTLMSDRLPDEFLPEFARLREQYRVMSILEKPNVIGSNGQINPKTLDNKLKSRNQGFGRSYTRGSELLNPETNDLLELARRGNKGGFKPHKSSGTAENQALDNFIDEGTDALQGLTQGDPTQSAGFLMRNAVGPLFDKAAEAGGGLPYDYLFNRGNMPGVPQAGGAVGRSMIDEALYPFVGIEDERRP